jgi:hypothetical protein
MAVGLEDDVAFVGDRGDGLVLLSEAAVDLDVDRAGAGDGGEGRRGDQGQRDEVASRGNGLKASLMPSPCPRRAAY